MVTKELNKYVEHFNELEDLEVINYTEDKDTARVDMVVNDRGVWDKLSDRQFRTLTDKIDSKDFNSYKMNYRIVVNQDPTGIVLTLVYNKTNTPDVDEDLNSIVKQIQEYLKDLTV